MTIEGAESIMWKESLRIGNEVIDNQHKQLFMKACELLHAINSTGAERKEKCISIILFLRDYAIQHFADEEAFQKSIGYKDFDIHKQIHDEFKKDLGIHEKKLIDSDFADKFVNELAGMLIAWILYHVSDADQRIVKEPDEIKVLHCNIEIVRHCISNMWDTCSVLNYHDVKKVDSNIEISDSMFVVEAKLKGDATGRIIIAYPPEFVKYMVSSTTGFEPRTIGDLEISMLLTVSNFTFQTISKLISKTKDIDCYTLPSAISSKYAVEADEMLTLDTGKGIVGVGMTINVGAED